MRYIVSKTMPSSADAVRRVRRWLAALGAFALLLNTVGPAAAVGAGETPAAPPAETRADQIEVEDALGRRVTVPAPPSRIVTAGRAVLMIADVLYAFEDAPDRVVGVGRISQGRGSFLRAIDPNYNRKTLLERNVGPEQIAALAPDLVILKTFMRESLGRRVESLGIPVLYVELETPEQYQRDIAMLGTALREEDRAEELTRWFRMTAQGVSERTADLAVAERPQTLLLYHRTSGGEVSFQVPPPGWIQTRLVTDAGGAPVWDETATGGGWNTVSFEQIAAWDPQEIILVAYDGSGPEIRDRLAEEPRWRALQAVRTGRFHALPVDFYSWDQPDTRWILGLQWMATRLHPELFSDVDIDDAAAEFFSVVYRLSPGEYRETIAPLITGDVD